MCACTSNLLSLPAKEEERDVYVCGFKWVLYVDVVEGNTLYEAVCVTSHVSVLCVSPGHMFSFAASGKAAGISIRLEKRPPGLLAKLQHSGRRNPQTLLLLGAAGTYKFPYHVIVLIWCM